MATERLNYFTRRFEPALKVIPEDDKKLVDALMRPLEPVTAFFRAQRAEGFYGKLTPNDDLPEDGDSPYTIIRSNGGHKAYGYGEVDPYKRYLREIAQRMDDAIGVAIDTGDPEKGLFIATLNSRVQALRRGDLAEVLILQLNTRSTPRYNLFVGLLDRYLDPRGLKLVMQGWLQRVDPEQNKFFNDLARQITRGPIPQFRVSFGDMLAAGGMTVDQPWSGNTIPSEDNLRNQVGADSYVFPNNMDESTEKVDIPAMRMYTPQVTQILGWEEAVFKAKKIAITAHETGHAEMPFDEETIKFLGGRYMAIKELLAELFEVTEVAKLPRSVISGHTKQLIYTRSLARWRYYIDEYVREADPNRKAILEHYAWAGVWRTNYQERRGGVIVNEKGEMEVPNWNDFIELDRNLSQELLGAIKDERYKKGCVQGFIRLNSQSPKVYIKNGHYPSSPTQRAAA